jgi:hypothetical protein
MTTLSKATISSLLALAVVGLGLAGGWYAEYSAQAIRAHPLRYCYETFRGPVNATLYITDLDDSSTYLRYYRAVSRGQNPVIEFPLNGLYPSSPVYVQRWLGVDSALAEVVNYDEGAGKGRPSMVRCYVDTRTLHVAPPSSVSAEVSDYADRDK